MDSVFVGLEYIADYSSKCSPKQFIEFTFIHHDKKHKIQNMSAQIGNDKQLLAILKHAQKLNDQGYGVYYGLCPRTHATKPGRRGAEVDVDTIPAFWIEMDSVKEHRTVQADVNRLMASETPPTYCILSGGGVHAYWVLTEPCILTEDNRHDIKQTLKGLTKLFGGDPQASEFARVLRVPGFANTKPGRKDTIVSTLYPAQELRMYTLDEMLKYKLAETPRQHSTTDYTDEDLRGLAEAALDVLSPARRDDRETWLEVLMCLKEGLGDAGFDLADSWSSGSSKYEGTDDIVRTWDSLHRHDKTIATLFRRATEDYGSSKWRPVKLNIALPAKPTVNQFAPLTVGERGALYRYAESGVAALIDIWTASGRQVVDDEYLVCVGAKHGLTKQRILKSLNRLPEIFLFFDPLIKSHEEDQVNCECDTAFRQRHAGRPANPPKLYRLADRGVLHAYILKLALPQIVKAAFPRKDKLAAPVQEAFLVELGLNEAEAKVKAKEISKRYRKELADQPGWHRRMQEVRTDVYNLKLNLTGTRKTDDGEPDLASRCIPLPDNAPLNKRADLLAASFRALMTFLKGSTQMGHSRLCQYIGARWTELASVCRAIGVTVEKNQLVKRVVKTHPTLLDLCKKSYDAEFGGTPKHVQSKFDEKSISAKSPTLSAWALRQFKMIGNEITLTYHCANRYTLAQEVKPVIEVEPEKQPAQPVLFDVVTTAMRFWSMWFGVFIFERLYSVACIIWCFLRNLKREVEKQLTYAESWLGKVVTVATPWQSDGDRLVEKTTGEIQPASVQLSFDLLLANPSP